jgi:outer membrane immunogenic protein
MKRLVAAIGATIFVTAPALAADIPVKAAPIAPVMAPVLSWNGCYVGANAGGVSSRVEDRWTGIVEGPTAFAVGAATVLPAAANADFNRGGFTAGGQIGCNYQTGAFVFGGEADLNYTDIFGSRFAVSLGNTNGGPATIVPGNIAESFSSKWLSTIRGRAGIASGAWLFYGTGGVAIASVRFDDQLCFPTAAIPACATASLSDTRVGWTVGGGVEYMFTPNWTVKAEYLYVDLGRFSSTSVGTPIAAGPNPFPNAFINHEHRLREHLARVGVNYKFDWGAPLVARY